jgi:hypothetical protein
MDNLNTSQNQKKSSLWPLWLNLLAWGTGILIGSLIDNVELLILSVILFVMSLIILIAIKNYQSKLAKTQSNANASNVSNNQAKWSLPTTPVFVDPYSGFIFKNMLEIMKLHFKDDFDYTHGDAMINVEYHGETVMQIIDWPDREKGEKHNITLHFYPMFDKNVTERFKNCFYKNDFNMNEENNQFMAYFGDDFEKAAIVTSYVLATVYYIPTDAHLKYDMCSC